MSGLGKGEKRGDARRRGVVPLVAALVVLLAVAGCGIAYFVMQGAAAEKIRSEQEALGPGATADEAPAEDSGLEPVEDPRPANPVDFPTLKAEHPDVYA